MKKSLKFNSDSDPAGTDTLEKDAPVVEKTAEVKSHFDEVAKLMNPEKVDPPAKTPEEIASEKAKADEGKTPEQIAAEKVEADKNKTPEQIEAEKKTADDLLELSDDLEVPEVVTETPTEKTWIDVATRLGVPPPEKGDDFETFETNLKTKLTSEYERGKTEASAPDPDKYSPDERNFMEALKGGKKVADFITPLHEFNKTLAMSDVDLVKLHCKQNLKFTDDQIADQLAVLEQTEGQIAHEAKLLRGAITNERTKKYNEILTEGQNAWKAEQARQKEKFAKENEAVIAEFRSRKTYMGADLNTQHIEALVKNWENGAYRKDLDNPKSVVDLVLEKVYGTKRRDKLLADTKRSGKLEVAKKLANSPESQGASHSKTNDVIDPNDHFGNVAKQLEGQKVTGRKFG